MIPSQSQTTLDIRALNTLYKIISSYVTMFVLLAILAVAAGVGTFLENDFGNTFAKESVYTSFWYQTLLLLSAINMVFVFLKLRVKLLRPGPIFHFAFIVILLGAFVTHHFGVEGQMHIREGARSNLIVAGEEHLEVPFYVALKDFKMTRYPGTRAPSEYSSDVIVIDEANNKELAASVTMNHTLSYGGYKFFQSSYDDDEKGTIFSVNKDPGVEITYVGYTVLFLGLLLVLFDRKSRFQFLMREIKRMPIACVAVLLVFASSPIEAASQELSLDEDYIESYLKDHRENSKNLADEFGSLIVQGATGRMKPLDTQNREILNKLTGRSMWHGMDGNQVVLGIFSRPKIWRKVNIIKVKTPKLRALLGVPRTQKLVAMAVFFDKGGKFKLTEETNKANQLPPSRRGTFERDLIRVDELLNIAFMSQRGMLLKLFPLPDDPNNTWADMPTLFMTLDNPELTKATGELFNQVFSRDYDGALEHVESIRAYQKKVGVAVVPSEQRIDAELWYNQSSLFIKLSVAYLILGLLLLFYSLFSMFYNRMINRKVRKSINVVVMGFFLIHSFGIGLRWYIGGYAPISNTYETMIYIAYSAILAGVFFFRKSLIALGASLIMAGTFIFAAYLGEINPQITSLVPVLKSYWLSIHVSVITASYGFFGVSAILGLVTLFVFMIRGEARPHLDSHIRDITYINEATLTLGIVLLIIGNFLGAIWANESWGRYWGWDPKETWTYIAIIVYALVIHLRLMKPIYSYYLFAVSSILAFFTILMTYYGVNFYLSGMHSYATGDPVPFPSWAYYLLGGVALLMGLSFTKRKVSLS